MTVTIDGSAGVTTPGITDTGNLSVTGTATAASFIPSGSSVPANGMYLSAANTLNLATNSTNQVAISSTGIVTGTAGNLMLVQGTAQAATSGTAISFTGIPSWAKRITVILSGVSVNTVSTQLLVQVGSGSFSTTGYASQAWTGGGSTTGVVSSGLVINASGGAVSYTSSGMIVLSLVGSNTWVSTGVIAFDNTSSTSWTSGGRTPALAGSLDRIQVSTGGAPTFTAGTINIQYE